MDVSVLSISARAVLEAIERSGADGQAVLTEAGLRRSEVEDPDVRISAAASDRLWQAAYRVSGDPALALHTAVALPGGTYRIFHYVSANSATVGEAFAQIADGFALIEPRAVLKVVEADDVALQMHIPTVGMVPRPPAEYTLAALLYQTRHSSGVDIRPSVTDFGFPEPADAREHRKAFGPVRYGQPVTALRFTAEEWRRPIPNADLALGAMLRAHMRQMADAVPKVSPLRSRLAELIVEQLRPLPTQEQCARKLGMSGRTLQRRLAEEDTRFSGELDLARETRARMLLLDRELSIYEIGWMLGFSDQSSFSRAFRRWTGQPPGEFRRLS